MKVTAWDYPEGESLRELIDKSGLYPVTASTSLSTAEKKSLIDQGIVFCRDAINHGSASNVETIYRSSLPTDL